MKKSPFALVILDGLGYSQESQYNPFAQANLPSLKNWLKIYPHAFLKASGTAVGLLAEMHGNSAVGLLTIGAGRIIPQPVKRIHDDIINGSFFDNQILNKRLKQLENSKQALHIIGLVSDAAVHSSLEHIKALLKAVSHYKINHVYIHAFLDGRDSLPFSANNFLEQIDSYWNKLTNRNSPLASLHGRFYAMDRDSNWQRTFKTYDLITGTSSDVTQTFENWKEALSYWYSKNISDEFILPTKLINFQPIKNGDGLICFNIRADRTRQIIELLINPKKEKLTLAWIITFISYKAEFNVDVLYPNIKIENTLSDQLEKYNKSMFSIAETEKYAHITYFFNGDRELIRNNETRVLIPSKPIGKTYANNPEMSAPEITQEIVNSLQTNPSDFYLVNYANADMVGHSGDFKQTIKGLEVLDKELEILYKEIVEKMGGTLCITSDHGKAESLYDPVLKQPITSHTSNPVFFILINDNLKNRPDKLPLTELADIAPFILDFLNIPIPEEMKK